MKTRRHSKILELIQQHNIDTQEELLKLLRAEGYDVTQATVSRDIKELRLVKTLANDGKYKFVEAYTEGDKVIALWNGKGIPASIRYAWENNPPSSIYNTEGLPASSFQLAIINK